MNESLRAKHDCEKYAPVPLLLRQGYHGERVRGVFEQIVVFGLLAGDDVLSLLTDLDHSVTEPEAQIQLHPNVRTKIART